MVTQSLWFYAIRPALLIGLHALDSSASHAQVFGGCSRQCVCSCSLPRPALLIAQHLSIAPRWLTKRRSRRVTLTCASRAGGCAHEVDTQSNEAHHFLIKTWHRVLHSIDSVHHAQVDAHDARLRLASGEVLGLGGDPEEREIRESYEESEALLASARAAAQRSKQKPGLAPSTGQESHGQPGPAEGEVGVGKWGSESGVSLRGQQQEQQRQRGAGRDSAQAAGSEGDEYAQLFARMEELEAAEEAARLRAEEDGEVQEEEEEEEEREGGLQAGVGRKDSVGVRGYHPHNRLGALVEAADEGREPDSDDEDEDVWKVSKGESYQVGSKGVSAGTAAATSSAAQVVPGPAAAAAAPIPGGAALAAFRAPNQDPLKGAPKKPALKKGFL
eukprot:scaffold134112_cov15-Tisochrysis_lutea.AAC.1